MKLVFMLSVIFFFKRKFRTSELSSSFGTICVIFVGYLQIFKGSKVWKAIVDHAHTCIIDDKKIYLYSSPSKFNFVVAFDVVGQLMGIVRNSNYVHLDNLSEVEQASARESLLLAFENRKDITFVDDETSLVHQFPYESHDICVATDSVRNDAYATIEPDTSSPTIGPFMCPSSNFSYIGSEKMQQIRDPSLPVPDQGPNSSPIALGSNQAFCAITYQGPIRSPNDLGFYPSCHPSLTVPDQGPVYSPTHQALSDMLTNPNYLFEHLVDRESVVSLFFHHDTNHSETCVESCSVQQSNAGSIRFFAVVGLTMWVSRVRKRVMDLCDFNVQKRQRIG
ncbi:uncharacterized protein [Primulina eburnea]|uniref:uncharacterized protein n=1 Tax=Primulina eburnea TaxID=1245227 RepID=UPI003C6CB044